ncbi:hypothetical protein [Chitinophaga barathri]|uniref:Uncharacterized protein n=1 Tax=Chitinophaga barathri TaxID=1647451 RepID=A0A3N4MG70_9BACT|nr:hypothetical protein [Chitinophaga barathri]RPD39090.1 hypothetical protein EG028_20950 [Chitinophaga barathri]
MKHLKNVLRLTAAAVVMLTVSCQTQHELVKPIKYNFLENLDPDSVLILCPPPSGGSVTQQSGTWNGNLIRYGQSLQVQKLPQVDNR